MNYLDIMQVGISKSEPIGELFKSRASIDVQKREHDIIYRLTSALVSETLKHENCDSQTLVFKRPLSWFQRLKQDHYPKWLLDKYPVKYEEFRKELKVEVKQTYPMCDWAEEGHRIEYRVWSSVRDIYAKDIPDGYYIADFILKDKD